jgi:hypothetical protein
VKGRTFTAGLALVLMLVADPGAGAPGRDALLRPGRGIGRVSLGMTMPQVRGALGRHTFVSKRRTLGFGEEYRELQWGYARWTVGFQGRPGALRAVRVASMLRRERTRDGLGPGSTTRDIVRVYPNARCSSWAGLGTTSSKERWVFVTHPWGARTIFVIYFERTRGGRPPTGEVIEVKVQQPASGLVEQRDPCGPNWRRE